MKILITAINSKYIHSGLAVYYLKNYLSEHKNISSIVLEYNINMNINYILSDIYGKKPNVVCFSCYLFNITEVLKLSESLKKIDSKITVILGGPEVSFEERSFFDKYPFIDYIVKGEGEISFSELIFALKYNKPTSICGVLSKDYDFKPQSEIKDLDAIPFAYNSLPEISDKLIYYETSRGCMFNCSYCLSSKTKTVRYFSLEKVKRELLYLIDNNISKIKFTDRTFNSNPERTLEIFKFLVSHAKNTSYHFEIAADLLTLDILDYLKTVPKGLFRFEIGVQSTNPKTLSGVNRKTNIEKLFNNVRLIQSYKNIHIHLDLIAGLPYEDFSSFKKSFSDVFRLRPEKLQLGFLKLLKGTHIDGITAASYPPYEVLKTDWISFEELTLIKGAEEVLEKFYNSHLFEKSLEFIFKKCGPIDFFIEFGKYFKVQQNIFESIYNFYILNFDEKEEFSEYLKFDLNRAPKGRKQFLNREFPKTYECFEFLKAHFKKYPSFKEFHDIPLKEVIKHISFEIYNLNVITGEKQKTVLMCHKDKCVDITKDYYDC